MKEKALTAGIYAATMIVSSAISFQLSYWISKKACAKAIKEATEEGTIVNEPEKADEDEEI